MGWGTIVICNNFQVSDRLKEISIIRVAIIRCDNNNNSNNPQWWGDPP